MRRLLAVLAVLLVAVPAAQASRAPTSKEHAQLLAGAQLYAHLIQQDGPAKGLTGKFSAFNVSTAASGYGWTGVTFENPGTTLETLGLLLQRSTGSFWGVVDEGCCDAFGWNRAGQAVYQQWIGGGHKWT